MARYTAKALAAYPFGVMLLVAMAVSAALLSTAQTTAFAKDTIDIVVNGMTYDQVGGPPAYALSGEPFWAIAPLVSAIGGKIEWNGSVATVQSKGHSFSVFPDSDAWVLDGNNQDLTRLTFMHHDNLYVPVADLVRGLGCEFRYDPDTRTAYIETLGR